MLFLRITIISLALTVGYYVHIILRTIIKIIFNCSEFCWKVALDIAYLHTDSILPFLQPTI